MGKVKIPHPKWVGDEISAEAEQTVIFTPSERGVATTVKLDNIIEPNVAFPDRSWRPAPAPFEEWAVALSLVSAPTRGGHGKRLLVFLRPVRKVGEVPHGPCAHCGRETHQKCKSGTHFLCGYDAFWQANLAWECGTLHR